MANIDSAKEKLLVAVLGGRNSGKSFTWNKIFGKTVKTGQNIRRLNLTDSEAVEVFLVSGSPEEREMYVGDIINGNNPRIVLCSMQYCQNVTKTIQYFSRSHYFLFIHWLNPGYHDHDKTEDEFNITDNILSEKSIFGIRNAKINTDSRVTEVKDFIYGWAKSRNLLLDQ